MKEDCAAADQNPRLVRFAEIVCGVKAVAWFQPPVARGTLTSNHQEGLLQ